MIALSKWKTEAKRAFKKIAAIAVATFGLLMAVGLMLNNNLILIALGAVVAMLYFAVPSSYSYIVFVYLLILAIALLALILRGR